MIICHKNIEQIFLLVNSLMSEMSDIVVHVDSSVDEAEFQRLIDRYQGEESVFVVRKRMKGKLDDRSLVDIVLLMVDYVRAKGRKYKYYALLSGQDYPIKPIASINSILQSSYPKPFIDCTPYAESNWIYPKFFYKQMPNLTRFDKYITDNFSANNPARKVLRMIVVVLKKICSFFPITTFDRLSKLGVFPYGGSAWWILPDIAIDFIDREYREKSQIVRWLLTSGTPEETFFQTMCMLSPIKEMVEINPIEQRDQNCKTWAYFSDTDKPFVGHPYIFTINEFEKLQSSDCWFARKFDITKDSTIIKQIEERLLSQ